MSEPIITEALRLHALRFSIIPLQPREKKPIEKDWTYLPNNSADELKRCLSGGRNIGVRLGEPSYIIRNGVRLYLGCLDIDVKPVEAVGPAMDRLRELVGEIKFPEVRSGRRHASRHLYFITEKPFGTLRLAITPDWAICAYCAGRQMVLPPSVHPKSGKKYRWENQLESADQLPVLDLSGMRDVYTDRTREKIK